MSNELEVIKTQAKDMFMNHNGATVISKTFNIPRTTVQTWIAAGWAEERRMLEIETFEALKSKKTPQLLAILDKSGDIIHKFIKDLLERTEPIKPWEMGYVLKAMESLDKIYRLETNRPTDIIKEEKAMDAIELVKKIKASDPFAQIADAVYEEKE